MFYVDFLKRQNKGKYAILCSNFVYYISKVFGVIAEYSRQTVGA